MSRQPPGQEASGASPPALAFVGVTRRHALPGGGSLEALHGVSLEVAQGHSLAIVGRSGSGKSTLLHLAAGIDTPTTGAVRVLGQELSRLGDRARALLRRDAVGLVFQFFHLLPQLGVEENVLLPALIGGGDRRAQRQRARDLLERVGLGGRLGQPAGRLSGGEMQRVAICRALLRRPRLLLADEPTGNLDEAGGEQVMDLLFGLAREEKSALVVATHSRELAARADVTLRLHDGRLEAS